MSDHAKIGIAVAVLLVLVPLWNFLAAGSAEVFKKATSPKKTLELRHSHSYGEASREDLSKLPERLGPEDAPVTVTVVLDFDNPCHVPSVGQLKKLHAEYGDQVSIRFLNRADPRVAAFADMHKIGCEMGLLINGQGAYRLSNGRFVTFQGPLDMGGKYTTDDIRTVIDMLIEKKTGHPPKKKPVSDAEAEAAETEAADAPDSASAPHPPGDSHTSHRPASG